MHWKLAAGNWRLQRQSHEAIKAAAAAAAAAAGVRGVSEPQCKELCDKRVSWHGETRTAAGSKIDAR